MQQNKFKIWLKVYSLYFVIFSVLILLNACIGFSSAPFYSKDTTCIKGNTIETCNKLLSYTNALYSIEVIGSVVLVTHGLLGLTTGEHSLVFCYMRFLQLYSKIGVVFYLILVSVRTILYFFVMSFATQPEIQLDPTKISNVASMYAGFLAIFMHN